MENCSIFFPAHQDLVARGEADPDEEEEEEQTEQTPKKSRRAGGLGGAGKKK